MDWWSDRAEVPRWLRRRRPSDRYAVQPGVPESDGPAVLPWESVPLTGARREGLGDDDIYRAVEQLAGRSLRWHTFRCFRPGYWGILCETPSE